mmetsp:Transcript_22292/g.48696  ORF Transcript_22292/g.48696 Transcript_22292/m.48696 type:complete len:84 (+) Transcript_22292:312-563(+)
MQVFMPATYAAGQTGMVLCQGRACSSSCMTDPAAVPPHHWRLQALPVNLCDKRSPRGCRTASVPLVLGTFLSVIAVYLRGVLT